MQVTHLMRCWKFSCQPLHLYAKHTYASGKWTSHFWTSLMRKLFSALFRNWFFFSKYECKRDKKKKKRSFGNPDSSAKHLQTTCSSFMQEHSFQHRTFQWFISIPHVLRQLQDQAVKLLSATTASSWRGGRIAIRKPIALEVFSAVSHVQNEAPTASSTWERVTRPWHNAPPGTELGLLLQPS